MYLILFFLAIYLLKHRARLFYNKIQAGMDVMEFFFKVDFKYQWKSSKMLLDSLNNEDKIVSYQFLVKLNK